MKKISSNSNLTYDGFTNRMYEYKCAKVDLVDTLNVDKLKNEMFKCYRRAGSYSFGDELPMEEDIIELMPDLIEKK